MATPFDILTATPEQIQAYLDQRLANAPEAQKVIAKIDYVEPGSVRDPACDYYLKLGQYEGDRENVEIALQVKPGMDGMLNLALRLL